MAQPYIGEIRIFAGNFAPVGWLFCNGALIPISENEALFNLIGTTYGGDGQSTFGVPNLQARVPVGSFAGGGGPMPLGQMAGTENVTLTVQQIPVHTHPAEASNGVGTSSAPANNVPGSFPSGQGRNPYGTDEPYTTLHPTSVTPVGGSQPHDNMQPYAVINYIISLFGIYPSPT